MKVIINATQHSGDSDAGEFMPFELDSRDASRVDIVLASGYACTVTTADLLLAVQTIAFSQQPKK